MRCAIYLAVIGSAFTVLSSLPAAATISAQRRTECARRYEHQQRHRQRSGKRLVDRSSRVAGDQHVRDPDGRRRFHNGVRQCDGDLVVAGTQGTVNFNDYGWNFSVNNPAITFSEVSLDPLVLGHDWTYRFTATSDGEITLAFDINVASGASLGLLGWQVSFTGPGAAGGPVSTPSTRRRRGFSRPLW